MDKTRLFTALTLSLSLSLFSSFRLFSQGYSSPLRIPTALSANFGELRNNHFHSGIDYKTQQTENKPVYAVGDGYVSRITVSPSGFGLALYIDHPQNGHTSVYGHLNRFSKKIADYIKQKQYEKETFRIDVSLPPNTITVRKGEQIGLSGNTGSSRGAHLHFEIRDKETQEPLEVFDFLKDTITDTRKPDVRGIAFYPVQGKGAINGSANPLRFHLNKTKTGLPASIAPVSAWGIIGVGVKAYDLKNGQSNVYGVKHIRLFVDGNMVFKSSINRFSFAKTRMINSFIDFEDWRLRKSLFMKSFIEPGNTLPFYEKRFDGYININTERNYNLRYELEDYFGNTATYSFVVKGKKQLIPSSPECSHPMAWNIRNGYFQPDFSLTIPAGNLYSNFCYSHTQTPSKQYLSDIHHVNNQPIPLHRSGQIWIKPNKSTSSDTTRMGIIKIASNGKESWVGGVYKNGGVQVSISELGDRYAIGEDTESPLIVPQSPEKWTVKRRIVIKLSDNKSGIARFRGEINGKFVLFTHDVKSDLYTYTFDDNRISKGTKQHLTFYAIDGVGNRSEYEYIFDY